MIRVLKILVLAVIVSGLAFAGGQKDDGMMNKDKGSMQKDDGMMSDDKNDGMMSDGDMKHDDGMMSKDDSMSGDMMMFPMDKGMKTMEKKGQVLSFTDLPTAAKHVKDGPTVLFFAASWCPDCRALVKSLHEGMNPLSADTTLIVVDYDKSMDLKTKYGVTYQHTFVQIDGSGNKIGIWNAVDLSTISMKVVRGVM
jgi:thiol-disulfide isomerase/thioredoxin